MLAIIIPVLNEEAHLHRLLPQLNRGGAKEIIVVDGGSTDHSCDVAQDHGVRVIRSQPGRGTQLAAGAAATQASELLFLHADTTLPKEFDAEIDRLFADPKCVAGAFRLKIDLPARAVRVVEFMANLRCRLMNSPYGDQAIFVRRSALDAVGGVPEIPLLEDVGMIRKLKREGRIALSSLSVMTSGRCWSEHGTLRTTTANLSTCVGYVLGVNPHRLAAWRRHLLPPKKAVT